jgi:hypothetical protein
MSEDRKSISLSSGRSYNEFFSSRPTSTYASPFDHNKINKEHWLMGMMTLHCITPRLPLDMIITIMSYNYKFEVSTGQWGLYRTPNVHIYTFAHRDRDETLSNTRMENILNKPFRKLRCHQQNKYKHKKIKNKFKM